MRGGLEAWLAKDNDERRRTEGGKQRQSFQKGLHLGER